MDWLAWFLLESSPVLGAALFTANFVLLVYWRRSGRVRPLLIGLAVAVALLAVQTLVVTRREHAARILKGIQQDVIAAQTENLGLALSDRFDADGMGPDAFVEFVARQYDRVRVRSVIRSELQVESSQPDQFIVAVAYQADVSTGGYGGWLRTRWDITFERTAAGWRIVRIQPTYIDGMPTPDWNRIDQP